MSDNNNTIAGLNILLADATVLYQKLRHYHWNVQGREFFTLHQKFEELYTGWADAIDRIAERILAIDGVPLHTLRSMLDNSRIQEDEDVPVAHLMVEAIEEDLRVLHEHAGTLLEAAEGTGDRGTANLLDELRDGMEHDLWMLKSFRAEPAKAWS